MLPLPNPNYVTPKFQSALYHLALVGCLSSLTTLTPAYAAWWDMGMSAPTFETYLAQEYVTAAAFEGNDNTDLSDIRTMRDRAVAVQQGNQVLPLLSTDVRPVRSTAATLEANRVRLMRVLAEPRKVEAYPQSVAQAQVAYDCWALHQQAEANASHNLYQCENKFQRLIAALDPPAPEVAMTVPTQNTQVVYDIITTEEIMFDWDKATLSTDAKAQLDILHAALRDEANPTKKLALQGFADRSGNARYNQKLSERRVQAVVTYLDVDPADTVHINLTANGETNLPITTADGVREARNRLTKVALVRESAQQ